MAETTNAWKTANLSRKHQGQAVQPVVEWRFHGKGGYAVRFRMHDAGAPIDQQDGEWTEFTGAYQEVMDRLLSEGILVDDHRL